MMAPIRDWFAEHPRRAVFISATFLPFAYAPFGVFAFAFIAYGLFFLSAGRASTLLRAFQIGWLFGFGRFLTGMYWTGAAVLTEAEDFWWAVPFAVIGLPAGLALFDALAVVLFKILGGRRGWGAAILFVLLIASGEHLRATILTGFPWNAPVMVWAEWLWMVQLISVIGQNGMNLVVLLWLILPVALFADGRIKGAIISLGLITFLVCSFGVWRIYSTAPTQDQIVAGLVQPNITQERKWQKESQDDITRKLVHLTQEVIAQGAEVIVWPETALPFFLDENQFFSSLIRQNLSSEHLLFTGAVRRSENRDGSYNYYNSLQLWRGTGELLSVADKHKLVPFGEFLPFQATLEALGLQQLTRLRGGFTAGPKDAMLQDHLGRRYVSLICYEAIFPRPENVAARLLINVTNDAWFGKTAGPHQHLAQARLRAIETGVPIIRSANSGISAAYDGLGQTLGEVGLGKAGISVFAMPKPIPVITKLSADTISGILFMFCLICYILSIRGRKLIKN